MDSTEPDMPGDFGAISVPLDIAGSPCGPLWGTRFAVKENIEVAGTVSSNGNPVWAASHPPAALNAPVIDRLLAAGGRLVGKAHMDEMAYSLLGANAHYGTPVNPAAKDRHPGGSSSGPAAAVAAGFADFALGTDTAGSCRAPAAFCGIYGFRPSWGAVSLCGAVPLAPTLDTIGWFARDLNTLALVSGILLPNDVGPVAENNAITLPEAFAGAEPALIEASTPALAALHEHCAIREILLGEEFWSEALTHFRNLQAFEVWEAHGTWVKANKPQFGPGVKERFEFAASVSLEAKRAADVFRAEARKKVDSLFEDAACFVLPTAPFAAPLLSASAAELDSKRRQMVRLFLLASFFGLPQVSIPLRTPGAPLALSLTGRRWADRALLQFARHVPASLGEAAHL